MRFYALVAQDRSLTLANAGIKLSVFDALLLRLRDCCAALTGTPTQVSSHPLSDTMISSLWLRINWRSKLEATNSCTFTYFFSFGFVCTFVGGVCIHTYSWVCLHCVGGRGWRWASSSMVCPAFCFDLSLWSCSSLIDWLASKPLGPCVSLCD